MKLKYLVAVIVMGMVVSALASARLDELAYSGLQSHTTEEFVDLGLKCNDPDSAMAYYSLAIKRYETAHKKNDVHHYIRALNCAGYTSLFSFRDFSESCYFLLNAEQTATEYGDSAMLALVTLNLANIYVGSNNTKEAVKYYRRSMHLSLEVKDTLCYLTAYVDLLPQLIAGDMLEDAIDDVKKFNSLRLSSGPFSNFARQLTRGMSLQQEGDFDGAIAAFCDASCHIDTPFMPERYKIIPVVMQSNAYAKMGSVDKAIQCALRAVPMMEDEGKIDLCLWISNLYKEMGDTVKSEHYRLLYLDKAYDRGILSQRPSDVVSAKSAFERYVFLNDIERLEEESKIRKTILWVSVLWGVLVTLLMCWLWVAHRRLKKSKENLFIKNQTLVDSKPRMAKPSPICQREAGDNCEIHLLQDLAQRISDFPAHSSEPFSSDFSINRLATLLDEHPRKISRSLNECLGKNFNSWLSEIRIDEACRRLTDFVRYDNISIAGIAEGLGFKSRTHFAEVFKRITGLSPSEYQRMARKTKGTLPEKSGI